MGEQVILFTWNFLSEGTESLVSQETPQSWANCNSWAQENALKIQNSRKSKSYLVLLSQLPIEAPKGGI